MIRFQQIYYVLFYFFLFKVEKAIKVETNKDQNMISIK